jgi:hypothetical protein
MRKSFYHPFVFRNTAMMNGTSALESTMDTPTPYYLIHFLSPHIKNDKSL